MKNSKKIMLISGIIGLGTGLFFSGIILSILTYKTNTAQPLNHINMEQTKKDNSEERPEIIELKSKMSEKEIISTEPAITKSEPETISITIDGRAGAREIADLLEENEVIVDSNAFLAYIVSQNATRRLQHGTKTFALGSDNETVLKVLTTYE